MKRLPHKTFQYGNCLYESVANLIPLWLGKPVELRFRTIEWARLQVTEGTSWGYKCGQDLMTEMEMMTIMERQVSWITWLSWKIQKNTEQNMIF